MDPDPTSAPWNSPQRRLARLSFAELPEFQNDDLAAAFACFRRSALAMAGTDSQLRPALKTQPALAAAADIALAMGAAVSGPDAASFLQRHFTPYEVTDVSGQGAFLSGYYEPVVDGSLERSPEFTAPILGRPDDLRTLAADKPRPQVLAGLGAARLAPDGTLGRYPDRAAIEAEAVAGGFRPVVWLRDWVEVFLIQVQGSARVRLRDGSVRRLVYAGRNGHPYTSIGRILVRQGSIAATAMSLDTLKAWLRLNGQKPGEPGRAVMQANASYIFFELEQGAAEDGPIGGAGYPLTPLRSIAVDRTLWCYGLPVWIEADLPWRAGPSSRFARLMVAQDTGSAIVGPARADLFFGTGDEAGRLAGSIRHSGRFVVLLPNGLEPGR